MTSGKAAELCSRTALSGAVASGLWLLLSDAALASGGAFTGGALDLFTDFLVRAALPTGDAALVTLWFGPGCPRSALRCAQYKQRIETDVQLCERCDGPAPWDRTRLKVVDPRDRHTSWPHHNVERRRCC